MKKVLLSGKNISFCRRQQIILNQVSITLYENEVVALIGGNGTGKTTLLEVLIEKNTPDSGKISHSPHLGKFWLGYLPDKAPLYPDWKVSEFLESCAKIRGIKSPMNVVKHITADCHLQAVANKKCSMLSHGYRQRVGLAQALIHKPQVVILDEPTNGLDTQQKMALRPLLVGLKRTCSVLFTSHDWEEVLSVADRIYHLSDGLLKEVILPIRESTQVWAECKNLEVVKSLDNGKMIIDGRFVGFSYDGSQEEKKKLWQELSQQDWVINLYPSYPREALQEKLSSFS